MVWRRMPERNTETIQPQPWKDEVDIKGKKVSKLYEGALEEVIKKHYNEGNVIRKVNHDRFTLYSSRKVMFQPFW